MKVGARAQGPAQCAQMGESRLRELSRGRARLRGGGRHSTHASLPPHPPRSLASTWRRRSGSYGRVSWGGLVGGFGGDMRRRHVARARAHTRPPPPACPATLPPDAYLDYKGLKDLIKASAAELEQQGVVSFSPRTTSLTVQKHADARDSAEEQFFRKLEAEVDKVRVGCVCVCVCVCGGG